MLERLLIAGSGGQGIVMVGRLLASVAVKTVQYVTFFPAYGAEVRGGTSNCQVILSSGEIADPVPEELDSMIIMNQASADKFGHHVRKGCLLFINSSLCKVPASIPAVSVNATGMANKLGNICVANFIMLGAYLARRPYVAPADVEEGIEQALAGKDRALVDLNIQAFRSGLNS